MNSFIAKCVQEDEEEYDYLYTVPLLTAEELREGESKIIAAQYESAMTRRRSYVCDLDNHINSYYPGQKIYIHRYKESYLVGYKVGEVFIISHFAPFSLRQGMEMIRSLGLAVAAVTPDLSTMLRRCGWQYCGQIPQEFDGEICMKDIWTSKLKPRHLKQLLFYFDC